MIAKLHWRILKESVVQRVEDQLFQLGCSAVLLHAFSLAPLLIILKDVQQLVR